MQARWFVLGSCFPSKCCSGCRSAAAMVVREWLRCCDVKVQIRGCWCERREGGNFSSPLVVARRGGQRLTQCRSGCNGGAV